MIAGTEDLERNCRRKIKIQDDFPGLELYYLTKMPYLCQAFSGAMVSLGVNCSVKH